MLRASRIGREFGSVAVVAAACAFGGVVAGAVALRCCSADRGFGLSPRRATILVLAIATVAVLVVVAFLWPASAHAASSTFKHPFGLGKLKNIPCGLAGLAGKFLPKAGSSLANLACGGSSSGGGGSGLGSIVSGFASALPKLIPAFLGGVVGWFVGSATLSHLLPGVFHLLIWTPVVVVTHNSPPARLESYTATIAAGGLGSIILMAATWNWVAGMFDVEGGPEALTAVVRGAGAIFALPVWVFVVPLLVRVSDDVSSLLVARSGGAGNMLGALLGVGAAGGAATGFLSSDSSLMHGFALGMILVLVAVVVLLLLLLALKVAVAAAVTLLFAGFPLALMVWPVRKLGWLAEGILEAFVVVLLIPVGWALILAAMGVVASSLGVVFTPLPHLTTQGLGLAGGLLMPMIAIVLLWMLVALPRQLIHLALLQTISRRGIVGDTVNRSVVQTGSGMLGQQVQQHLPERWGGPERPLQPAHETWLASVAASGGGRDQPAGWRAQQALAELDQPRVRDSSGSANAAGDGSGLAADEGASADGTGFRFAADDAGAGANGFSRSAPARDRDGFALVPVEQPLVDRGIRQAELTRAVNPPESGQIARGFVELPAEKREAVLSAHERLDDQAFAGQMVRQSVSEAHPRPHRETFAMLAASERHERAEGINAGLERLERGEA